jgi:hypothetical protein
MDGLVDRLLGLLAALVGAVAAVARDPLRGRCAAHRPRLMAAGAPPQLSNVGASTLRPVGIRKSVPERCCGGAASVPWRAGFRVGAGRRHRRTVVDPSGVVRGQAPTRFEIRIEDPCSPVDARLPGAPPPRASPGRACSRRPRATCTATDHPYIADRRARRVGSYRPERAPTGAAPGLASWRSTAHQVARRPPRLGLTHSGGAARR